MWRRPPPWQRGLRIGPLEQGGDAFHTGVAGGTPLFLLALEDDQGALLSYPELASASFCLSKSTSRTVRSLNSGFAARATLMAACRVEGGHQSARTSMSTGLFAFCNARKVAVSNGFFSAAKAEPRKIRQARSKDRFGEFHCSTPPLPLKTILLRFVDRSATARVDKFQAVRSRRLRDCLIQVRPDR